jgi:hypothetical protein
MSGPRANPRVHSSRTVSAPEFTIAMLRNGARHESIRIPFSELNCERPGFDAIPDPENPRLAPDRHQKQRSTLPRCQGKTLQPFRTNERIKCACAPCAQDRRTPSPKDQAAPTAHLVCNHQLVPLAHEGFPGSADGKPRPPSSGKDRTATSRHPPARPVLLARLHLDRSVSDLQRRLTAKQSWVSGPQWMNRSDAAEPTRRQPTECHPIIKRKLASDRHLTPLESAGFGYFVDQSMLCGGVAPGVSRAAGPIEWASQSRAPTLSSARKTALADEIQLPVMDCRAPRRRGRRQGACQGRRPCTRPCGRAARNSAARRATQDRGRNGLAPTIPRGQAVPCVSDGR